MHMSKQYGDILADSYTHFVTPLCMVPVESKFVTHIHVEVRDAYTCQSNKESELVFRIYIS